jgi:hypothetical protein
MGGVRSQVTECFCKRSLLRWLLGRSAFILLLLLLVDSFGHTLFPLK